MKGWIGAWGLIGVLTCAGATPSAPPEPVTPAVALDCWYPVYHKQVLESDHLAFLVRRVPAVDTRFPDRTEVLLLDGRHPTAGEPMICGSCLRPIAPTTESLRFGIKCRPQTTWLRRANDD